MRAPVALFFSQIPLPNEFVNSACLALRGGKSTPNSYNPQIDTCVKPIAKPITFCAYRLTKRAKTTVSISPNLTITKHCRKRLCRALLVCSFTLFIAAIAAQEQGESSRIAPKLLNAIDDQTLFLSPKYADSVGPVGSQRIYLRDLHTSFGRVPNQTFSVYPYDKKVVDAWIVENFLIVLAKSTGTAQVAVTATNSFGSMIDWFIVNVEQRAHEEIPKRAQTAFESELLRAPIYISSDNVLQLPALQDASAKYRVVPALPSGLVFDNASRSIRGRVDGVIPNSIYYWIGVSRNGVGIQQFVFAPVTEQHRNARNSDASLAILGMNESLPSSSLRTRDSENRRTTSDVGTARIGTVAASRPHRIQNNSDISVQRNLLDGITSAMHSRFRDLSLAQDSAESRAYTLWNYASTRYPSNSNRAADLGIEPSGIYVGFDTRLEENLTTGLSISFDSRGYTNSALPRSSRSPSFTGASLSSIMPYARWHDGSGGEIWGVVGFARDNSLLDHVNTSDPEIGQNSLLLGAVGWRHLLGSTGNLHLTSVGDAGLTVPLRAAELDSDASFSSNYGARSLRAGLEMSFSGEQVQPYVGVSGRVNSSPVDRDTSLEALGGVRYTSLNGLTFEAEGRALSAQNVFENPNLVFSVAAHLDPGLRGEGLALSVTPMFGSTRSSVALNPNSAVGYSSYLDSRFDPSTDPVWAMSGSLSYGMAIGGTGVITPFGQIAISTLNQTRMGVRVALNSNLDRLFNLEIATVQSRFEQEEFDKGVDIQLRLVF